MPTPPRILLALLAAVLLWPAAGRAGTCDAAKVAHALERRLDCRVHPTAPACVTATEAAFGSAAACLLPGDAAGLQILWLQLDGLAGSLGWGGEFSPATSCGTVRVRAAAHHARVLVGARAGRVGVHGVARSLAMLTKRFAAAETRGDCGTNITVATANGALAAIADRVAGLLDPTCGDGIQAGAEACDGLEHAGCPFGCESACLCKPAPVCGNGIIEPPPDPFSAGEQCDGQALCDAMCQLPQPSACCEFADASGAVCLGLSVIGMSGFLCQQAGGVVSYGSCMPDGGSCPPTFPPQLCEVATPGHCGVVPVPPTTLCCAGPNGCSEALVQDSGAVSSFLTNCLYGNAAPVVGSCGPAGACVPAS